MNITAPPAHPELQGRKRRWPLDGFSLRLASRRYDQPLRYAFRNLVCSAQLRSGFPMSYIFLRVFSFSASLAHDMPEHVCSLEDGGHLNYSYPTRLAFRGHFDQGKSLERVTAILLLPPLPGALVSHCSGSSHTHSTKQMESRGR